MTEAPSTMRAVGAPTYGPIDQVRVFDAPVPTPGKGQVRIRVIAAGANPADCFTAKGEPKLMRIATGIRAPRRAVLGFDVAGVVDAVGPGVTTFGPGQYVFGEGISSFAEYCVASVKKLALIPHAWIPANTDASDASDNDDTTDNDPRWAQAAATPMAGTTAATLLRAALPDPAGKHLLIIGAGGGIGTFLVQLAAHAGAKVTAVCSEAKHELVRELGATITIDHNTTNVADLAERFDAIVDNVAVNTFAELIALLNPGGLLVTNSGTGTANGGAFGRPVRAFLMHTFARKPVRAVVSTTKAAELERLGELSAAGTLRAVVGTEVPMERAVEALRVVADGHATGKVVIRIAGA